MYTSKAGWPHAYLKKSVVVQSLESAAGIWDKYGRAGDAPFK